MKVEVAFLGLHRESVMFGEIAKVIGRSVTYNFTPLANINQRVDRILHPVFREIERGTRYETRQD